VRLTEVRIEGLRSLGGVTVQLAPVTVIAGPNGGGKSTVLGAIAYGLTGRYPGVIGTHVDDIKPLARDADEGFLVRLYSLTPRRDGPDQELIIERGCGSKGHRLRTMGSGVAASRKVHDAEATIMKHFGEPGFAVDAFDPERSIWRKSIELRMQWAFALCAGKAGWTHARLGEELGEPNEDWDPLASEEPSTCLEINLLRLDERYTAAQRVSREAATIAEGIALVDPEPTEEEIAEAEKRVDAATSEQHRLQAALGAARTLAADAARVRAELDAVNEELKKLRPPEPPAPSPSVAETIEAHGAFQEQKLDPAAKALSMTEAEVSMLKHTLSTLPDGSAPQCPICASHLSQHTLQTLKARLHYAEQKEEALTAELEQAEKESQQLYEACVKATAHKAEVEAYERALSAFASHRVSLQRSRDAREAELASIGVNLPGCKEADVEKADQAHVQASQALWELRKRHALARERAGQREAGRQADARAAVLSVRRDRMREVRKRMLHAGVAPLLSALTELGLLAPPGSHWMLVPAKGGVALGYAGDAAAALGQRFVPVEMMSSSEKYRATIALLVATAIVRRPPWVGIFLDNFEQVHPVHRTELLSCLASLARAGLVDNVLIALADTTGLQMPEDTRAYLAREGRVEPIVTGSVL
jgi:seryl-tRNA synthetase